MHGSTGTAQSISRSHAPLVSNAVTSFNAAPADAADGTGVITPNTSVAAAATRAASSMWRLDPVLTAEILDLIASMAEVAGDFLTFKFKEDLWPALERLLRTCAEQMPPPSSSRRDSAHTPFAGGSRGGQALGKGKGLQKASTGRAAAKGDAQAATTPRKLRRSDLMVESETPFHDSAVVGGSGLGGAHMSPNASPQSRASNSPNAGFASPHLDTKDVGDRDTHLEDRRNADWRLRRSLLRCLRKLAAMPQCAR